MREKPLNPTLREKKRYIVYEVITDDVIDSKSISAKIKDATLELVGTLGAGKAGLMFFDKKYNQETKRGFVKVSHTSVDEVKVAMGFIKKINNSKVIINPIYVSGMIAKAEEKVNDKAYKGKIKTKA